MAPPAEANPQGRTALAFKQHPKPVTPVLPLGFAKRTREPVPNKYKPADPSDDQALTVVSPSAIKKSAVNGEINKTAARDETKSSAAHSLRHTESHELQTLSKGSANQHANANGRGMRVPNKSRGEPRKGEKAGSKLNGFPHKTNGNHMAQQPPTVDKSSMHGSRDSFSQTVGSTEAADRKGDPEQRPAYPAGSDQIVTASSSRPPPSISPTRYQMPAPFHPNGRTYARMNDGDISYGSRAALHNAPAPVHHSHPSNESIHFGTFQNSQTSSPAPPHSGGVVPPPAMAGMEGHHPAYLPPPGNGFPPMMPYATDLMQPAPFDHLGRPAPGFGPVDAFVAPYGNHFAPSTPHSFNDSQSSGQAEDNFMYQQYPPNAQANGSTGPGDLDSRTHTRQARPPGPPDYPRMPPALGPPPHLTPLDNGDWLVDYMQQQFGIAELADCTLELRYTDDRAPPVRIPGHRLIFARSAGLGSLLREQSLQGMSDQSLRTLLLTTGSRWLRSDSFYMAVQRLYGLPLLSLPPARRPDSPRLTDAGTSDEQLNFALSYAAAGHLLNWTPVLRRGCEVAIQLLGWHSMEQLLEFALEEYIDTGSPDEFKYGEGSKAILAALVMFIVHNLPPTFSLDSSPLDPKEYARFPEEVKSSASWQKKPATVIARGSSVQLGKTRRPQQITGIQFGDMSMGEDMNEAESQTETPKAARQARPVAHDILSRALINLPFSQLKMILESAGSGNVHGWANAESRYRIIRSVVEEREARRLGALDAVLNGEVSGCEEVRAALRKPYPQNMGRWSILGWQEEILPHGSADGPALGRKWVPHLESSGEPCAAYP